ncbi:MAG: tetratricopeptide repeat protein [Saprospiraceae bacterium]
MAKNQRKPAPSPAPKPSPAKSAAQTSPLISDDSNTKHWLWMGLCVLLTLLAYLPAFDAGFVNWDDDDYVTKNLWFRNFDNFSKFFTVPVQGNLHPLTMISLAINYSMSGEDAWSYHLFNVLLHLANTAAAYWLAWKLSGHKFWVALVVGMLFGLHPMRVESVAWVSERKDVLYSFFFLLGLIGYERYVQKQNTANYLLFTLLYVCSLASKPAAVVFPVLLLAIDYWLNRPLNLRLLLEKIPHFALAAALGLYTVNAQTSQGATDTKDLISASSAFFYGFYSYMMYWVKMVWPFDLCTFYPFPPISRALPATYMASPLFALLVGAVVFWSLKKNRLIAFAVAFFTINVALILQFKIVGSAIYSDRYTYMPYWGGFFLLGYGLYHLVTQRKISETMAYALVAVLALGCTALSYKQAKVWQSPKSLWVLAIEVAPCSGAYSNLAVIYRQEKNNDKAFELLTKAIELNKADDHSMLLRGNVYFERQEYAKAMADYNKCLEINPRNASAYSSRGSCLGAQGQHEDALRDITKALEMDSTILRAYVNRGLIQYQMGRYEPSIADYRHYLVYKPDDADVWNTLGVTYFQKGDAVTALECYNKSIQLNSKQGVFFLNRARLQLAQGNKAAAASDVAEAQKLGTNVPVELLNAVK